MSDLALKMGENGEIYIPLKLKESPRVIKLTKSKQQKFLQTFAETGNFTKAAAAIRMNRTNVYKAVNENLDFSNAFAEVKEAFKDQVREVIITMGQQPLRENFNYTKLFAEAQLPEYKKNADIAIQVNVNNLQASGELHNMLSQIPINEK